MPTRWTQSLIPTLRQVPAEAEVPSHQLMLRAGFIRKLGAGMYDYLPLGWRSLSKAMAIIREEMAAAGAVEIFLPTLIPMEMFKQTGRDVAYGDNLFRVTDRHGRQQALGPTHEEVVVEMFAGYVESYKQLPLTLYQIQTKFRDEFRPRFGVLRSREFQMKDAYSFHMGLEGVGGLNEVYQKQYDAYCRVFSRCGLPYLTVEAESGPIGGSASHEFMVPSPTGEDTILESDKGNYAANVEKAETGPRKFSANFPGGEVPAQPPKGELAKIHTPGCPGIEDVCEFFKKNMGSKLATKNMLKTLVWWATKRTGLIPGQLSQSEFQVCMNKGEAGYVLAVVRGDHEVNEGKLKQQLLKMGYVTGMMLDPEIRAGFAIGFVGPHASVDRPEVVVVIDSDAAVDQFWVTGANEVDHHVKCFDWKRDMLDKMPDTVATKVVVADIRNAVDGDPSPKNDGGVLRTRKGIEVGHVFKLGDKYTKALNVTVLGADNQRFHPIMGCYGIGCNRILAAAIERTGGHDENGIIWPAAIAPYKVVVTPIKYDGQAKEVADRLADSLEAIPGVDVLIDDRDERPGVKFKDADLIGIPVRITIGEKTLAEGKVEVKARTAAKPDLVPIDQAAARAAELLKTL